MSSRRKFRNALWMRARIRDLDDQAQGRFRLEPETFGWEDSSTPSSPFWEGQTPEMQVQDGQILDAQVSEGSLKATRAYRGKPRDVVVPYTLPEEEILVRIDLHPQKKGVLRGQLQEVFVPHSGRVPPRCKHFGVCGGCALQHADYDFQLAYKEKKVRRLLVSHGLDDTIVAPIRGMDQPWGYRNKMEFTFRTDGIPGLHVKGMYRKILPISECYIAHPDIDRVRELVGFWAREHGLSGYDKDSHTGLLRHLVVRKAFATDELLIALVAADAPHEYAPAFEDLIADLKQNFSGFRGLLWVENSSFSDAVQVERLHVLEGRPYIEEVLAGFRYRIELETFFQINPRQAEVLISTALAHAREVLVDAATPSVVDLYAGVGTFTLPLAHVAETVVGVEVVAASVEAARNNAAQNGIANVVFHLADAGEGLAEVLRQGDRSPALLFLDPPRSGAGPRTIHAVLVAAPEAVVYVSCNPTTFVEDAVQLKNGGYELISVIPVDMFPHTPHVELVALFRRKG